MSDCCSGDSPHRRDCVDRVFRVCFDHESRCQSGRARSKENRIDAHTQATSEKWACRSVATLGSQAGFRVGGSTRSDWKLRFLLCRVLGLHVFRLFSHPFRLSSRLLFVTFFEATRVFVPPSPSSVQSCENPFMSVHLSNTWRNSTGLLSMCLLADRSHALSWTLVFGDHLQTSTSQTRWITAILARAREKKRKYITFHGCAELW